MIQTLALFAVAAAFAQDPPKTVIFKAGFADTTIDLWEELRQVDPAFKALGDDVARLAKALESDEIEARAKAASQLKGLGLTAYGPIKALRDKTSSDAVRAELDAVLKSMAGDFDKSQAPLPGARCVGEKEILALKARMEEKRISLQHPNMALREGQRGTIVVGDARPVGVKVRTIVIEGGGTSARLEQQGPLIKSGFMMDVVPKVDGAKGIVTLEIKATTRALIGLDPTEVTVRLTPQLRTGEGFLAGPFPSPEEKGNPWWLFVIGAQVIP